MKNIAGLLLAILFISCGTAKKARFNPDKKYAPSQLRNDFSTLQRILQHNHPGLYWYATPDSIDGFFASTLASLNDSLTEQQFRNKISWTISKIHCGHTTVRSSRQLSNYLNHRRLPQFPLSLKVWGDSAVVVANSFTRDSILKRGTIITHINGVTVENLVDSICQLIGTDGYSDNFKYQLISFNFPGFYRNAFGLDSIYQVNYLDSLGGRQQIQVRNFGGKKDTPISKQVLQPEAVPKQPSRKNRLAISRSSVFDSSLNTAFLTVNTFSSGRLRRFFKSSFKKISEQHLQNVVVDLRLNSGGDVLACTKLTQYLINKPFHVADTVAAFTRTFPDKKHIRPWFIYWLSMQVSGKRYSDNRIHFRYFENHYFKPVRDNHFDGNIYLLTGGYTFSAATLVAESLKGQENVTIVGEETGGGAYGNSAMFLTNIVLPNTGIRVTLPLYRMVLNATLPKNGRGVFPDVEVGPSSQGVRMGVDSKLEKVKELITERRANKGSADVKTRK